MFPVVVVTTGNVGYVKWFLIQHTPGPKSALPPWRVPVPALWSGRDI